MTKQLKISDFKITETKFATVVTWGELEKVFGKKRFKEFEKWIAHQTVVKEGVYVHDVERFLNGANSFRF